MFTNFAIIWGPHIHITATHITAIHELSRCKLSDYIIRQQLREVAEKIEDGPIGPAVSMVFGEKNVGKNYDKLSHRNWITSWWIEVGFSDS